MSNQGWIGVDLDGTLAHYDGWVNVYHVGEPVLVMLDRVKAWLAEGREVRIFTARVGPQKDVNDAVRAREAIEAWCQKHLGQVLPITATKDFAMVELWDDRCVQVVPNSGRRVDSHLVDISGLNYLSLPRGKCSTIAGGELSLTASPPYLAEPPADCPRCKTAQMQVLVTMVRNLARQSERADIRRAGYGACACGFQGFVEDLGF